MSLPRIASAAPLLAACLLLPSLATAGSGMQFSLGTSLKSTTWSGENPGSGGRFEAQAPMLSLEARLQRGRWFGGLTLSGGEFEFADTSPARPTGPALPATQSVTVSRGETDLVAGYRIRERIALFADIKSVANTWSDNYKMEYSGLGIGISGFLPLGSRWLIFGNLGFVSMDIKVQRSSIGNAKRSALNMGVSYRIADAFNVSLAINSQSQINTYRDGSEQTHELGSLALGINATF